MTKTQKLAKKRSNYGYIYYGPPGNTEMKWKVKLENGKVDVNVDGHVFHALRTSAGSTFGCHLANCIMSAENRRRFGHPVLIASVNKQTLIIITKFTPNNPNYDAVGVLYHHRHGQFVDLNDTKEAKKRLKEDPDYFEREFTFLAPRRHTSNPTGGHRATYAPVGEGSLRALAPRGALQRAVKAGIVAAPVARAMRGSGLAA
jgi:hypothetical protein